MNLKDKIRGIVNDIKSLHFSNVRATVVVLRDLSDYHMVLVRLPFKFNILIVDPGCGKFNNQILEALVAREFCHYNEYKERDIDLAVVKFGYGPGLLEFRDIRDTKYKVYRKTKGLSRKELQSLIGNKITD